MLWLVTSFSRRGTSRTSHACWFVSHRATKNDRQTCARLLFSRCCWFSLHTSIFVFPLTPPPQRSTACRPGSGCRTAGSTLCHQSLCGCCGCPVFDKDPAQGYSSPGGWTACLPRLGHWPTDLETQAGQASPSTFGQACDG